MAAKFRTTCSILFKAPAVAEGAALEADDDDELDGVDEEELELELELELDEEDEDEDEDEDEEEDELLEVLEGVGVDEGVVEGGVQVVESGVHVEEGGGGGGVGVGVGVGELDG
jgi:hypothetical protein